MAEKSRVYQRYQWLIALEPTKEKFKYPKKFNPTDYFRDSFGIFHGEGPAEKVILKVEDDQVKYFVKPHHSQNKRDDLKVPGYTFCEYKIAPAFDFVQFICSKGNQVEVIEPQDLRNAVAEQVKKMYESYKKDIKGLK